jgi:hypothetical protein
VYETPLVVVKLIFTSGPTMTSDVICEIGTAVISKKGNCVGSTKLRE